MDSAACVLDLDVRIENDKFISAVFDKRDDFKFDIVQFKPVYCIPTNQASTVYKYNDIL